MLPSVIGGPRLVGASYPSARRSRVHVRLRRGLRRADESRAGGGGDEAGGGAEVAAVVVAGFAFARAAGGFMAASSAMTGSGVMTVVGALPASPVCMELDSFTAMRTGTLCG